MGGENPNDEYHFPAGVQDLTPYFWHTWRKASGIKTYNIYADEVLTDSSDELPQAQPFSVELSPPPRELIRQPPPQRVAHAGGKRPRKSPHSWKDRHGPELDSGDDDDGSQVDLEEYFASKRVQPKTQVLMCRSYASYVASRLKEKKRLKLKELHPYSPRPYPCTAFAVPRGSFATQTP